MLALTVAILGATATAVATAADPMFPKYPKHKIPPMQPAKPTLDPVWARQLQTQWTQQVNLANPIVDRSAEIAALRRQTQEEKAAMMNTVPGALTAPVSLSVRAPYIDSNTHMEVASRNGVLEVLPLLDQVQMRVVAEPIDARPTIYINFRADPTRRYHVECSVAGFDQPQNISASDGNTTYSVNTSSRATLVYIVEPRQPGNSSVKIAIYGEKFWVFRGCDITSASA
jgi:hypothetical protein